MQRHMNVPAWANTERVDYTRLNRFPPFFFLFVVVCDFKCDVSKPCESQALSSRVPSCSVCVSVYTLGLHLPPGHTLAIKSLGDITRFELFYTSSSPFHPNHTTPFPLHFLAFRCTTSVSTGFPLCCIFQHRK